MKKYLLIFFGGIIVGGFLNEYRIRKKCILIRRHFKHGKRRETTIGWSFPED